LKVPVDLLFEQEVRKLSDLFEPEVRLELSRLRRIQSPP